MKTWNDWLQAAISGSAAWPNWVRYLCTIVLVVLAGFVWQQVDVEKPFLLFFPAIIICAVFFGRGTGYLATLIAAAFSAYILPPADSFVVIKPKDEFALIVFILIGITVTFLIENLRARVEEVQRERDNSHTLAGDRKLLIDELAHRTRNDLANVVTLLKLQAASAPPEVRETLKSASDRVQSIARVHRQLEVKDERVVVDSKDYLEELCGDLQVSRFSERPIRLECIAESHKIGLEKAVPLGLMVNELLTNAAKHAFPEGRAGEIKVSFARIDGHYRLKVEDNGVGPVPQFKEGLGTKLLGLLAGQLGSKFEQHPGKSGMIATVDIPMRGRKNPPAS